MQKGKRGKPNGGNAHDRAMARASMPEAENKAPIDMGEKPSVSAQGGKPPDRWTLGDASTVAAFAVSMICWALVPNIVAKTLAVLAGIAFLLQAGYRGPFARSWKPMIRHIAFIFGSFLIIIFAGMQLAPEWKLLLPPKAQRPSPPVLNALVVTAGAGGRSITAQIPATSTVSNTGVKQPATHLPTSTAPPVAQPGSPESDLIRHLLSKEEQENFEAPLLAQTDPKETIILNCPVNQESDCAYALQFVDLFREAGFTVDGNMVHRITLRAPYYGVVLGEHVDKDLDPN
jgi:hypothetical protein